MNDSKGRRVNDARGEPRPGLGQIKISHLTKRFGNTTAVEDLSFTVEPGRITGFLGPNGAGKTTTLRMLLGLIRPSDGSATVSGRKYTHTRRSITQVGAALEATGFHPGRSGRNHLRVIAASAGLSRKRVDETLELVGLGQAARKRVGGYSLGMRQRLGLATALVGHPRVLILDEPANGLDPEGIRWLRGFLRFQAELGVTVLISSHLLQEVDQTVDDVVIINHGRLVKEGSVEQLRGGARALVRTPDAVRLAGALQSAQLASTVLDRNTLHARSDNLRFIGEVASRAGLPIWELREDGSDLEELYFALTDSSANGVHAGKSSNESGPPPTDYRPVDQPGRHA